MGMIRSLLDTDLYKFSMMQGALHHFSGLPVTYAFACRNSEVDLRPVADEVREEVRELCRLTLAEEELAYLRQLDYLTDDFVDSLQGFRLDEGQVQVSTETGRLEVLIDGPWVETILFEVPLLAIVNELYFRRLAPAPDYEEGRRRLRQKVQWIRQEPENGRFLFSDFGTRRRFSRTWQEEVVTTLQSEVPTHLVGTSNVHLAKALGLTPIGTMAHEWLMAGQVMARDLRLSQKMMLQTWVDEYQGRLGIALSDIVGLEAFLNDFDRDLALRFDGVRQDSGDPYLWADKVIKHYRSLGIDPKEKTLVFSDGLDVPRALAIYRAYREQARLAFGIGTNLTNDLGYTPLQIVIKPVAFAQRPVAKISDSPGKCMCRDEEWIRQLAETFQVDIGNAA